MAAAPSVKGALFPAVSVPLPWFDQTLAAP
jgi:hypothetical protein